MTPVMTPASSNTGESTACTSSVVPSGRTTVKSPSQVRPRCRRVAISVRSSTETSFDAKLVDSLSDHRLGAAPVQHLAVRVRVADDPGEIDDQDRGRDPVEEMRRERGDRYERPALLGRGVTRISERRVRRYREVVCHPAGFRLT